MEHAKPMGHIRRGWELTKSSWQVLKLDKELAAFPLISILASLLVLVPFGVLAIFNTTLSRDTSGFINGVELDFGAWGILIGFTIYLLLTLVSNVFGAAVIYGAVERFRGTDPTIRSCMNAVKRRFGSIAAFSLLSSTIGYALQALEQRVPFAGKIAVWLVNAAWNIATMFAIPVIVLSDRPVKPLDAAKQSVGVVKRVWGESVIAQFSLAIIGFFYVLGWIFLTGAFIGLVSVSGLSGSAIDIVAIGTIGVFVLGTLILTLVFSTLGAIAKAAVYYYATTNESPELFNKELLRDAMTPKKARKIFG
jgi:hypothetical protein